MIQEKATVLWNREIRPAYYGMGLACTGYAAARPGQFVMLRVSAQNAPLLRRPFSIHRLIGDGPMSDERQVTGIELLYKVVGLGTQLLAGAREGETLDLLGPIGNGFTLAKHHRRIYLVGGGIGVPPLVFLATVLRNSGRDMSGCRMFLGGRTQDDLLCREDFEALGVATRLTTDDGSAGDQCLVTHPLEMAVADSPPDIICACGPMPMLSCVVGISQKYKVPCQVSIESMMACGMGACLGCAVKKRQDPDRYWHVCKDGPVFDANKLIL